MISPEFGLEDGGSTGVMSEKGWNTGLMRTTSLWIKSGWGGSLRTQRDMETTISPKEHGNHHFK